MTAAEDHANHLADEVNPEDRCETSTARRMTQDEAVTAERTTTISMTGKVIAVTGRLLCILEHGLVSGVGLSYKV
jgi:hypothetical protein